jgi:hypothetical protein
MWSFFYETKIGFIILFVIILIITIPRCGGSDGSNSLSSGSPSDPSCAETYGGNTVNVCNLMAKIHISLLRLSLARHLF